MAPDLERHQFGRNVLAWTIVGLFVGPMLWQLQIVGVAVLVASTQETKTRK